MERIPHSEIMERILRCDTRFCNIVDGLCMGYAWGMHGYACLCMGYAWFCMGYAWATRAYAWAMH
eukprot:4852427-Lingulodinium_polyedra.AAC.1